MSIKNIKERLEGSYRLIRIKRIKLVFFTVELALGLALALAMAFILGTRFEPLYFPLDTFAFIFLIMVLIISIEAIYFKGLEIRYTRNKSRKYLVARNSIRRSAIIIAVAGACILLLMMPQTHDRISELHSPSGGPVPVAWGNSSRNTYFMTQDSMGLTRASTVRIDVSSQMNDLDIVQGPVQIWSPGPSNTYEFNNLGEHSKAQNRIYIEMDNLAPEDITFTYSVTSQVSPILRTYLPALGLAFIIVQFAAISIMYPIREAYASSSIYSKKYVTRTEAGEYSVSQIKKAPKDEDEMLDQALEMELPPPPPRPKPAQMPAPAEEAEMARAKGRVDEGLVEEPDIRCGKCGEMNSAHSAICFSCGTPMAAVKAPSADPTEYLRKGETFAKAGKYEDAITCYDETLKHDAGNELALLRKGEALHKLGKWGSAIQYVNTALKVNPRNVDSLILKARILEERDRFDKSMEVYSQILALDPENKFAKSRMEKVSEEVAMVSVEDVLEEFMCIPGIGLARATALYDAGFTGMDMLRKATEEQLVRVKGISKGIAKKIRKGLDSL